MSVIDTQRFAELGDVWSHRKPAPGLAELCEISFQAANSYRVLHLRWIEGWPIAAIAAAVQLTPQQVRARLHHMKRRFRSQFNLHTAHDLRHSP